MEVELRQRHPAHLRLRDEPGLRARLCEHVVRVAEAPELGRARAVGAVRLALQDQDVQRVERHVADLAELGAGDPLVLPAEVLAHERGEVVDAAPEELARHARGLVARAGEQADGLGAADLVEHVVERAGGEVGEERLLPALLDAGEGELHGRDVRHHLEVLGADLVGEVAGGAVEQRVAAGDDGGARLPDGAAQLLDHDRQVGADDDALGAQLRQQPQGRLGAEDELGAQEQVAPAGGQAGEPVRADADDWDLAGHACLEQRAEDRRQRTDTGDREQHRNWLLPSAL